MTTRQENPYALVEDLVLQYSLGRETFGDLVKVDRAEIHKVSENHDYVVVIDFSSQSNAMLYSYDFYLLLQNIEKYVFDKTGFHICIWRPRPQKGI